METYKEFEYAKSRLVGTIVRRRMAGGQLKAVNVELMEGGEVIHRILSNNTQDKCKLAELDISPVPLGYVNLNNKASYLTRKPMRQDWRQGFRNVSAAFVDYPMHWEDINFKKLSDTIEGIFPTFKQVIGKVVRNPNAEVGSMAFSRELAINTKKNLLYKTMHVGDVDDEGFVKYLPTFEWVDDTFREVVNA